jgi:ABC-type glycerol-3-phosphate transport system substrate-binding protein
MAYAGLDDYSLYMQGLKNWDTPEARTALETHIELSAIPIWPEAFATMTIDEFHAYFNNQEAACAMYLATWYTGRAFKPADEGGQAADFSERLGMLRPVEYPDAEYNGLGIGALGSGYAGAALSENPDVVGDILASLATPEYGAMWVGKTASPTAILHDAASVESEYGWYFEILDEVYGDVEVVVPDVNPACGEISTALTDVINQGIPLGIVTDVDEAVELLNEGLCEGAE